MEQELPVPREDLVTRKAVRNEDKNKVFKLPELDEFVRSAAPSSGERESVSAAAARESEMAPKVDRSNSAEYLRVLQLNPFADADETMFLDEVGTQNHLPSPSLFFLHTVRHHPIHLRERQAA